MYVARPPKAPQPARVGRETQAEREALTAMSKTSLEAAWKTVTPEIDHTPRMSYSQEKLRYIPPVEGSRSKSHGYVKSEFGSYLEKAIMLKVDLKSVSH